MCAVSAATRSAVGRIEVPRVAGSAIATAMTLMIPEGSGPAEGMSTERGSRRGEAEGAFAKQHQGRVRQERKAGTESRPITAAGSSSRLRRAVSASTVRSLPASGWACRAAKPCGEGSRVALRPGGPRAPNGRAGRRPGRGGRRRGRRMGAAVAGGRRWSRGVVSSQAAGGRAKCRRRRSVSE